MLNHVCDICEETIHSYKERKPYFEIEISPLDEDGFMLNNQYTTIHVCEKCFKEKLQPLFPRLRGSKYELHK